MDAIVTFKGNRECRECGGRLKDVSEPDEGTHVYQCQKCGKIYNEDEV